MENKEYIKKALVTESRDWEPVKERLTDTNTIRLLHAGVGLSTEVGEVLDALKKHIFYGKPLDKVNLKEEMGDLFWYMAVMADALEVDFKEVMERNIAKLTARYGEKFSEERAINRDTDNERKILEG